MKLRLFLLTTAVASSVIACSSGLHAQSAPASSCNRLAPAMPEDPEGQDAARRLFRTQAYLQCLQSGGKSNGPPAARVKNGVTVIPDASPAAINERGDVAGYFDDSNGEHAFVLPRKGAVTKFDVPGSTSTSASAIDASGAIAGDYCLTIICDARHGYLRSPDGSFTSFDPPNATITKPTAITPSGDVTGYFYENGGRQRGFLRRRNGAIVVFDAPSAWGADEVQTKPSAINPGGIIVGDWSDGPTARTQRYGFVRAKNGVFTPFWVGDKFYTTPVGVDASGAIAGAYRSGNFRAPSHGFLRSPAGTIVTFNVRAANDRTAPVGVTLDGVIVGAYDDESGGSHGFLRSRSGAFTSFDAPGANHTYPTAISSSGAVTGYFCDSTGCSGFVMTLGRGPS